VGRERLLHREIGPTVRCLLQRADMQLTWRLAESGELSCRAKSAADHHVNSTMIGAVDPSQVKRSVYAKLTCIFERG